MSIKNGVYYVPTKLIENPIEVVVIGAGGTGSEMLDRLVRLHFGLIKTGHEYGLNVTLIDGDTVSESNIGRQRFIQNDIGESKAHLLIHRANVAYGINWKSVHAYADPDYVRRLPTDPDIVITCVDKAKFRAEFGKAAMWRHKETRQLWLDTGNGSKSGQVVLGHWSKNRNGNYLPNVYDLFPELSEMDDDDKPSCSFEEAIQNQDLFVNPVIADQAANLLWQLLRHGKITYHGIRVNVQDGTTQLLKIDPKIWSFFGYQADKEAA